MQFGYCVSDVASAWDTVHHTKAAVSIPMLFTCDYSWCPEIGQVFCRVEVVYALVNIDLLMFCVIIKKLFMNALYAIICELVTELVFWFIHAS